MKKSELQKLIREVIKEQTLYQNQIGGVQWVTNPQNNQDHINYNTSGNMWSNSQTSPLPTAFKNRVNNISSCVVLRSLKNKLRQKHTPLQLQNTNKRWKQLLSDKMEYITYLLGQNGCPQSA